MQAPINPLAIPLVRRNFVLLHGGVAAGILIAVIAAYLILMHLRQETEARAAAVTQTMTQAVDLTVDGLIDTIDVALLASSEEIGRQIATGKPDRDSITRFLVRQKEHLHHVAFLRALNEHGEVIYGPDIPAPRIHNGDREFFIHLRDNPNTGLFVAKPVVGRIAQKWIWPFARRINKPDGSFGGIVVAAIHIDEIENMLAQIRLEPGSVISLRDAELGLIARSTFDAGAPIPPGDKRLSTGFKNALKISPSAGTFVSDASTPDGVSRTYSYRRNQEYGYTVNVGLGREQMLTEWRFQIWTAIGLVAAFILIALSYSRLLGRTWHRQAQNLAVLEAGRESLHQAQKIARLGSYDYDLRTDRWTSSDILDEIFGINSDYPRDFQHWLSLLAADMQQELKTYFLDSVIPKRLAFDREYRIVRHSDGQERWVHGQGRLRFDEQDNPVALYGVIRDITESKQLAQEREQYFNFFQLTTDAMCIADPFGCFKRVNPAFEKLTGYNEIELVSKPFLDFILPEDRDRTSEEMRLQVAVRPSMQFENRYVCKDGKIIVLSWTAYFDQNDGVTYATARDVTELRMAEETLERFFTLIPDLMCIASVKGYFLKFNPVWSSLLGYSEAEIAATPYIEFVHPDDRAATGEAVSRQVAGEEILNFVNRFRCRNGDYRYLEWRTTPAINNAVVFATARDITERMQMEAALQESEARFRRMFENNGSVMLLIEPDSGAIVDANAAAARFYGYPGEHLKALRIDQINTLSPEEIAARLAQATEHESNCFIFPHRLASGELRTVEVRSSPIEVGSRVLLFSIINDVTEREIALAELKRSNAELEQFSYAISHDMRQPLRMISSYLQLLGMELADQLEGEKREFFDFAIDGAKRLDRMLVALLEYSRVGRIGEAPAWIESRAVLDNALLILQPAIEEAHARLVVSGDWPRVFVCHDEILRLMQNLVDNALKFRIVGRTPEITIASATIDKAWRMSVTDNGVGIIPGQIDRLFQVFQRLQARTAYEGTGVGLALCRKIAEHHHGRIWAESAGEGQGSTFSIELPRHAQG